MIGQLHAWIRSLLLSVVSCHVSIWWQQVTNVSLKSTLSVPPFQQPCYADGPESNPRRTTNSIVPWYMKLVLRMPKTFLIIYAYVLKKNQPALSFSPCLRRARLEQPGWARVPLAASHDPDVGMSCERCCLAVAPEKAVAVAAACVGCALVHAVFLGWSEGQPLTTPSVFKYKMFYFCVVNVSIQLLICRFTWIHTKKYLDTFPS
jgi:hypothetical protein